MSDHALSDLANAGHRALAGSRQVIRLPVARDLTEPGADARTMWVTA